MPPQQPTRDDATWLAPGGQWGQDARWSRPVNLRTLREVVLRVCGQPARGLPPRVERGQPPHVVCAAGEEADDAGGDGLDRVEEVLEADGLEQERVEAGVPAQPDLV